ncbi:dienelactone hydrolase family protein [Methylocystis sp. 9N]|uniref:Dienelactone hydrolase family protein n=1 Tax=Methylocystis borbori TaxID=3118750 RepID=A0ABU7XD33_9HYPH
MTAIVEGPRIAALSCGKPAFLVVLLHGPGADGEAIVNQALNWAPTMPKADFLAAEAPFPAASGGRQWFDTTDWSPAGLNDAIRAVGPLLDQFLDEALARRRLPDSHLALVGFSHGAMLALHVGLRRQNQMAALVAFSGALYDEETLQNEMRSKPPVLMIHGEEDPIVPFSAMTATKERLKAQGVPVKSMRRPGLGHEMDDDGVIAAGDFLTALVVHKPAAHAEDHDHDHDHDDHS